MEIEYLNRKNEKRWTEFVNTSDDCWLHHTIEKIRFDEFLFSSRSKSFLVLDKDKIVGIMPLLVNRTKILNKEYRQLYSPGCSGPALSNGLSARQKKETLRFMFSKLDDISRKNNIKRVFLLSTPLSAANLPVRSNVNYMTRYGLIDSSLLTRVLDLRKDTKELFKDISHGHKYEIKKGIKNNLRLRVFDKKTITEKHFKDFYAMELEIYRKTGRDLGSYKSFVQRLDFIKKGYALLFAAQDSEDILNYIYVTTFRSRANYTSGGDNFNIKKSQNHFLQWKIIEYLKENNFEFYELGWQQYPTQLNMLPTDKEVNISRYKRSFGGFDVSVYGGEKFYSKSLFLLTSLNRMLKYFFKVN